MQVPSPAKGRGSQDTISRKREMASLAEAIWVLDAV